MADKKSRVYQKEPDALLEKTPDELCCVRGSNRECPEE